MPFPQIQEVKKTWVHKKTAQLILAAKQVETKKIWDDKTKKTNTTKKWQRSAFQHKHNNYITSVDAKIQTEIKTINRFVTVNFLVEALKNYRNKSCNNEVKNWLKRLIIKRERSLQIARKPPQ